MDDEQISITRRRNIVTESEKEENEFYLYEEFYILSYLRSSIPTICDPVCICLRICILADLTFNSYITIDNKGNIKYLEGIITDPILKEVHNLIKENVYTPKEWIYSLNGESFSYSKIGLHIKNLRFRITKKMEENRIFISKKRNNIFSKRKYSIENNIKRKLCDRVIEYLTVRNTYSLRIEILIGCLSFCSVCGPILNSLPPKICLQAKTYVNEIRKKFKETNLCKNPIEIIVYQLMKTIYKY
ncbi:putative Golgi phosphoprotein [Hamiltosporidium tvaerminnensis]|uniref:Putative Golgi phosphoprotein n=1 Tax=Hamiltosporidium tvaerminnensis TaxID=1176355 RepID=A0A4Q9LW46_9MICR|nr:putative Golgi phosphoprotein [Hamiltosporidium tvaerminnensis]